MDSGPQRQALVLDRRRQGGGGREFRCFEVGLGMEEACSSSYLIALLFHFLMNRGRPSAESKNGKRIVWGLGERKRHRIVVESNGSVNWVGMYSVSAWQIRDPFVIHGHEVT